MQVFIVSLLFIGIIMVLIGLIMMENNDRMNENTLVKQPPKLDIRDDNMPDQILQQQFSTSEQDSIIESQFTGPTITDIFGEQFEKGALFSHGFILGTDLKPLHESELKL